MTPLRPVLQQRLRQAKMLRFSLIREVLFQALDVPELGGPAKAFADSDKYKLQLELNAKFKWDHHKDPFDITFLSTPEDLFSSEIFVLIIEKWQAIVPKAMKGHYTMPKVPLMEELCVHSQNGMCSGFLCLLCTHM